MTATTETTEAPETDPAEPVEPAETTDPQEQQDDRDPAAAARREAAKYRRQLRDTEAERDRLAGQVQDFQRTQVEALAESGHPRDRLVSGSDLWTTGIQLADLLDESGAVDPGKAREAVTAVLSERPHWRASWGEIGQGARQGQPTGGRSFADLLRDGAMQPPQ